MSMLELFCLKNTEDWSNDAEYLTFTILLFIMYFLSNNTALLKDIRDFFQTYFLKKITELTEFEVVISFCLHSTGRLNTVSKHEGRPLEGVSV